ncbi:hypothetical protein ABPG72_010945 [Tetrahymena utriculariae]
MIDNQCVRYLTESSTNHENLFHTEISQNRQIKQSHIEELTRKYEESLKNYVREHQEKYSQLTLEKLDLQDKVKKLESENRQLQVKLDSNLRTPYEVKKYQKIILELEQNLLFSENQKRKLQTEMDIMKRTVHLRLLVQQQNIKESQELEELKENQKQYKNPEIDMTNQELLKHIQELGSEKLSPKNYSLKISMLGKTIQQLKDELTKRNGYYEQLENDIKLYKQKYEEISWKCDQLEIENKKIVINCQGEIEQLTDQKDQEIDTLKKQISHYSQMYAAANANLAEQKEKYEARQHNQELETDKIRHEFLVLDNLIQKNARDYQEERMQKEQTMMTMETSYKKEIFDLNGKLENELKKYIRLQNQHQDEMIQLKNNHKIELQVIRNEKIKIAEALRQKEIDFMKQIQHQERQRQQDALKYSNIMKQMNVITQNKGSEDQVFEEQIKEMDKNLKFQEKEQDRLKEKIDEYRIIIIDKEKLIKDKDEIIEKQNIELKEIKFSLEREKMKWDEQKREEIFELSKRYEQRIMEEEDRRVNELSRQKIELTNKVVRIEEKYKEKNNFLSNEFDKIKNIINTRNELIQVQFFDYQQESLLKVDKLLIQQELKVQKIEEQYQTQIQQIVDKYEGDIKILKERHTREINSLIFKYEEEVKKPMLRQVQFYKEELNKIEQDMNIIKQEDSEFHVINEILKHCKSGEEVDLQKENIKIIYDLKNKVKSLNLDLEHSQQQRNMLSQENDAFGKKIEILIEKLNKARVDVDTQCDFLTDELTYEKNLRKQQEKELQLQYENQIQKLVRDQEELVKQFSIKHNNFIDLSEERYEDLKKRYDLLLEDTYSYKIQCDKIIQDCDNLQEEINKLQSDQKTLIREMEDREKLYSKLYQTEQDKKYQSDWKEEQRRIKKQMIELSRKNYLLSELNNQYSEENRDGNAIKVSSESENEDNQSSPLKEKIKQQIFAIQNNNLQEIKQRYAGTSQAFINYEENSRHYKSSKSKSLCSNNEDFSLSRSASKKLMNEQSNYNDELLKEIKSKHETFKSAALKSESSVRNFKEEKQLKEDQDFRKFLDNKQLNIQKCEPKRLIQALSMRQSANYKIQDTSEEEEEGNETPQKKQRPNTSQNYQGQLKKSLGSQKRLSFDSIHAIIESNLNKNIAASKLTSKYGNKISQITQLNKTSTQIMRAQTLTRVQSPEKGQIQRQNIINSSGKKVLKINKQTVNKFYKNESQKHMKTYESANNQQNRPTIQSPLKTNSNNQNIIQQIKLKPTYAELYKQIFNQRLNFEVKGVHANTQFS